MQLLIAAMTLAAGLHMPAATTSASCEFVYLRDNAGYSQCQSGTGYQHRADGWCFWAGIGDPEDISEYAKVGPWADPTGRSPVSCPKFYYLSADIETR
ncbi:hypothetical protein [Rhizocola hellebori]|nr:hypothetical protein [Rhizocola hellebori]